MVVNGRPWQSKSNSKSNSFERIGQIDSAVIRLIHSSVRSVHTFVSDAGSSGFVWRKPHAATTSVITGSFEAS